MRRIPKSILAGAAALCVTLPAAAATTALFEYAFNVDGTVTNGAAPAVANLAGFDTGSGLGTIALTLAGTGTHRVGFFADLEIDEALNTFFNEFGQVGGAPAAGQSWEIDEPGFVFGDIYANFVAGVLDGGIGVTAAAPDDVSMAMAWTFDLAAGETAAIQFRIGAERPASGFFLEQVDPDSQAAVYMTGSLAIRDGGPAPEPATLALIALGMAGGLAARRRPPPMPGP